MAANQADFFGEGVNTLPSAPPPSETETEEERIRRMNAQQGYGPAGHGGHGGMARDATGGASYNLEQQQAAYDRGNVGGATGAHNYQRGTAGQSWEENAKANLADEQARIDAGANTAAGRADLAHTRFNEFERDMPSITEIGDDVRDFLGPVPEIDPNVAGAGTELAQDALGMTQEMIDEILGAPSIAKEVGERALRHQLALSRSARGGPGAAAAATDQALNVAPQVASDAAIAAAQEQGQRQQTAAGLAQTFTQGALGFQGQDVDIAKANQSAGLAFNNTLVQASGMQLSANEQHLATMGQFARDMASFEFDWAQLDVDTQLRMFDVLVKKYGLDKQSETAIKVAAKNNEKGALDWITGIAGSVAGITGAVKGGK